jgi:hypothetical protein
MMMTPTAILGAMVCSSATASLAHVLAVQDSGRVSTIMGLRPLALTGSLSDLWSGKGDKGGGGRRRLIGRTGVFSTGLKAFLGKKKMP